MGTFKEQILFIHRWLGLITGLVVVILSVTGCLFVFQQEITEWIREDTIFVDEVPDNLSALPIEQLQARAADALDIERLPYGLTTYNDPQKNWTALLYKGGKDSWTYFGSMEAYKTAYINPYNGQVEGIVDEKKDFFQIVKGIHWSLLLATPIGQPIVVWITVIFIVLLITGLVLWWPKRLNKSGRQRSFKIKWGSTWRRVNYDLHNVLGFYFLLLSLVIAFTGLYWYFPSAKKVLHFIGTGEYKLPETSTPKVVSVQPDKAVDTDPLEIAYTKAWSEFPDADRIEFLKPADSSGTIRATVRMGGDTYYEKSILQFDQYTGEVLHRDLYSEKNAGEKLLAMNYDIHVGAIGGIPGKIIAFLASLVCASLPISGFIIWWDRERRKRSQRKSKKSILSPPGRNGQKRKKIKVAS